MGCVFIGSMELHGNRLFISNNELYLDSKKYVIGRAPRNMIMQVRGEGVKIKAVRTSNTVVLEGYAIKVKSYDSIVAVNCEVRKGSATRASTLGKKVYERQYHDLLESMNARREVPRRIVKLSGDFEEIIFETRNLYDGEFYLKGAVGLVEANRVYIEGKVDEAVCRVVYLSES